MIKLTGKYIIVEKYSGKSKYEFWTNLQNEDVITISYCIKSLWGGYNHRLYSPTFNIYNHRTATKINCSCGDMINYFKKIKIQELES